MRRNLRRSSLNHGQLYGFAFTDSGWLDLMVLVTVSMQPNIVSSVSVARTNGYAVFNSPRTSLADGGVSTCLDKQNICGRIAIVWISLQKEIAPTIEFDQITQKKLDWRRSKDSEDNWPFFSLWRELTYIMVFKGSRCIVCTKERYQQGCRDRRSSLNARKCTVLHLVTSCPKKSLLIVLM